MLLKLSRILLWVGIGVFGCSANTPRESSQTMPVGDCRMVYEEIQLRSWGKINLPKKGSIVMESHYATKKEVFGANGDAPFPAHVADEIQFHTEYSCALIRAHMPYLNVPRYCEEIYSTPWANQWAKPEGGEPGQGSVGQLKPTRDEEMWGYTMYWAKGHKPIAGDKWLVTDGRRSVVVVAGYETGPSGTKWLAGVSPEVSWYMGNDNRKKYTMGRLVNPDLQPGPIECITPTKKRKK